MALSTTQYGYIIDPLVPLTDDTGRTISNGYVRVFMAGTSTPVITYKNFDGATNEETVQLDNSGRTAYPVIGSKGSTYKVCVYDSEHSQETPIKTIDKVVPAGANVEATNIVTGLDNVTVQEENFLKATVSGTDVELALDPTEVTSEVSTISDAATAAPDYVVPLLGKTGTGDGKKISLANLFKFALGWISRLATTITDFRTGDVIPVDGPSGPAKMGKDNLLARTTENALGSIHSLSRAETDGYLAVDNATNGTGKMNTSVIFNNFAGKFVPNSTTTIARRVYIYDGLLYMAKETYQGPWDASKFSAVSLSKIIDEDFLVWDSGYYTNNSRSPSKVDSSSYKCAIISVYPGCKVYVRASLSSTQTPWAIWNKVGYIARRASSAAVDEVVEVADGEEFLVVQSSVGYDIKVKVFSDNGFEACTSKLNDKVFKLDKIQGKYFDCSGTSVPATMINQADYSCGKIFADVGDTFFYFGSGSSTAIPVCTFDSNGDFVRKITGDYRQNKLVFTIEDGEVGFVFNDNVGGGVWASNISIVSRLLKPVEKIDIPPAYKKCIPYIGNRKILSIKCGQQFYMRCKVKYPKDIAVNPSSSSKIIGVFGGVGPFIREDAFSQTTTTYTLPDSTTKTSYWPSLKGGITMNGGGFSGDYNNTGYDYAFGIQYTGNGTQATISNNGINLVVSVDGNDTTFVLSNYQDMEGLFADLSLLQGFSFKCVGLEGKTPADLVVFSEVKLVSSYYGYEGPDAETQTEYIDNGVFFIPYADETYHNFEVFCIDNKVYSAVDGIAYDWNVSRISSGDTTFDFYGQSGFEFKDVEIFTEDSSDVELVTTPQGDLLSVSEFSPLNVIFEGHDIVDSVSTGTLTMTTTTDRMFSVFSMFKKKGYVPVTMDEVIASYNGGKRLPKRSFTIMLDDYQFEDALNINTRRAILASGVHLNLAVITGQNPSITYEGGNLTLSQAVNMVRLIGGDCFSHTKEHTRIQRVKLSEIESFLRECIKDADIKSIKCNMLVYPFGDTKITVSAIMNYLGMDCGLSVANGVNFIGRNKYKLKRVEIGERVDWDYLESWCL